MRPLFLLSNDDGVGAEGLLALREALLPHGEVIVCAPATNQSASSHSLTLHHVLRIERVREGIFAVDGTPADCIFVAMNAGTKILPRRPDVVVSGMNHGPNLGGDVFYSGTVAAAREGAMRGVPAIAISADNKADRKAAATLGAAVASRLAEHRLAAAPSDSTPIPLLNVNIPPGSQWPLTATRLGKRRYEDDIISRQDPRGREYIWIGGARVEHDPRAPGDVFEYDTLAYDHGSASVTPLSVDAYQHACESLTQEIAKEVDQ